MQFSMQRMPFAGPYWGHLNASARSDVHIAASPAFLMRMLARVAFEGNRDFGIGLNVPHGVEQITGVLRPQFEADLTPQFARGKRLGALARPYITKANLRGLGSGDTNNCPSTGGLYRESSVRERRDDSIGHTQLLAPNPLQW